MSASFLILWAMAGVAGYLVWRRSREQFWQALDAGKTNVLLILPRIALALITAGFVAKLLPSEAVGHWIGPETGFSGIVIASLIGAAIPSGPIIAFPIVLVLLQAGAGVAQIVAFLTSWAVYALHRVLMYEATLMGWHFAITRMISSIILPLLAGVIAMMLIAIFGTPRFATH
ncbi:MAG: hypothetical protein RLZ98_1912 [Pseudomonadota bacterium]|jgi:uncharacterized membrane protein YraQ (UPF0718 family)